MEFDKDKYLPPHLTINEAWLLGEVTTEGSGKLFDRKYQLKLPEMK